MHIGLIGLGTMGANLARNAARRGATVSVYNRTIEKTDAFIQSYGSEGKFVSCRTIDELLTSLPRPRTIIVMVNAGKPVDDVIADLITHSSGLTAHDTIIDAGNSHYKDTERREKDLKEKGIHFLGMGVSGGEEGALKGPSMMPGGDKEAYERLFPLLEKMSAKDGSGGKCVTHVGGGGAGHFVKMVHNGIEYGDMQLIAESYHLLKAIGLRNEEIAQTFASWNRGRDLRSFLIEITAKIFMKKDDLSESDLIDVIKDAAKQKGTGKWTTESALDLGLMIPTITSAVDARYMSAQKPLRIQTEEIFGALDLKPLKLSIAAIKDALLLSKICSYAQGFAMIAEANRVHQWGIDLAEVCRIWKGGCIIRSTLLKTFEEAFRSNPALPHLLLAPVMTEIFAKKQKKWRTVIAKAQLAGIPVPSFSASLSYFDSIRSGWLPQNLTQAQRDFFGAHTFERIDTPGTFHAQWS